MKSILWTALLGMGETAIVRETLVIQEWVVDYLRPTVDITGRWPWETSAERKTPYELADT